MVDKNILQTLSRAEWEGIIYQRIFSERDRWLVARHLLDGVPYDRLTAEYQARYTDARWSMTKFAADTRRQREPL